MLSINTNLSSLIAQRSMKQSTHSLNTAIERMTTGFKINHSKDNAANYSICTNMDTKIGALQVAEDNCAMGLDVLATANGTLDQISDKLQRLRNLAVQASNGTYGPSSIRAMSAEVNALIDEIERIYNSSEYGGVKYFGTKTLSGEILSCPNVCDDGFIQSITRRNTSSMTSLASVDGTTSLADGTYAISTPEEMKKLADMTNAGLVSAGDEFVLANDIDLSQYENWEEIGSYDTIGTPGYTFKGIFDGNGYVISNLKMNTSVSERTGLFGFTSGATIKNLGVINADVKSSSDYLGIIAGFTNGTTQIVNCYTTGSVHSTGYAVGGIVGVSAGSIEACYSYVKVFGGDCAGGICGSSSKSIKDSFFNGEVAALANNCAGGITGRTATNDVIIENCHANIKNSYTGGALVGYVKPSTKSITINNCSYTTKDDFRLVGSNKSGISVVENGIIKNEKENLIQSLQVGTDASENSKINLDLGFDIAEVNIFRFNNENTGRYFSGYYIKNLDRVLERVSNKQTELGATENRLNSALDEISTQYENLVSSRSTLRDADIAEVSSTYIQQQILQQASATLLATANQSPSIALQLI